MTTHRKCSHIGFWVWIALLSFFLLFSIALNGGLLMGLALRGKPALTHELGEDEFPELTERWSYGDGDVKAVRIAVRGLIFRELGDSLWGSPRYDKIEEILRQIRAARNDDGVHAIILEVDSPGGELTPSDEIYRALADFKESMDGRRVVAFVSDLAASGGYYIAMPADWIIAQPTAIIGSIGVIMQTLNWKGLSEKIGVTDTTIKSGGNKDLLNPFHDVPPEQIAMLQGVVDSHYQRFFDIVREARGLSAAQLRPMADGRIFTASEALKQRLIDEVGDWDSALVKTAELLGRDSVKIVRYEYRPGFFEMLSQIRLPDLSRRAMLEPPRLMYLWRP